MINLSNIDLISVNCVDPENSVRALLYSSKDIEFGSLKLFEQNNFMDALEYIGVFGNQN